MLLLFFLFGGLLQPGVVLLFETFLFIFLFALLLVFLFLLLLDSFLSLDPFSLVSVPDVAVKVVSLTAIDRVEDNLPFELSVDESLLLILVDQDLVVRIRHLCDDTLEHSFPQRVQLRCLVAMIVLAAPSPRRSVGVRLA